MSKIVITKVNNALKVVTNDFVGTYDAYNLMIANIEGINCPTGVTDLYVELVSGKEHVLNFANVDTVGGNAVTDRSELETELMTLINP